ncbi:MAG: glycerol-3-phosphate 1-O-acyltransferase PlsY [Acidobacteriota bacterium]
MTGALLLVLGAYLLGSVSFSFLIVRAVRRRDVRTIGSGNAGATNVLRAAGLAPALTTLLLDVAKGMLPVWLAERLGLAPVVVAAAAIAVVVGHIFPLYFRFRGGKGVATAIGALGVMAPLVALAVMVVFLLTVLVTRYVSLGSMLGAASYPALLYGLQRLGWVGDEAALWIASPVVALLVLVMHFSNFRRLRSGDERPLSHLWQKRGT